MTDNVRVRTPCRLHIGMFSFGRDDRPQFGGVGVMIDPPCVEVAVTSAERFSVSGALADRGRKIVELLIDRWQLPALPDCEISIFSPRDHTGLGVGTQLHLATATALRRFLDLDEISPEEISAGIGRGARSAVGTYGFHLGGLIVDAGKETGQSLGTLATRVAIPDTWRFVLFRAAEERGLAGPSEAAAFERLPPVPDDVTRELWSITNNQILPGVVERDLCKFGEGIYQFGVLAGGCFATVQDGPFASPEIEQLVNLIRAFGVPGAGQSSWGPTVFAVTSGDDDARLLLEWVRRHRDGANYDATIARPNNCGAAVISQATNAR